MIAELLAWCAREHWYVTIDLQYYRDGQRIPGYKGVGTPGYGVEITKYHNESSIVVKHSDPVLEKALAGAIRKMELHDMVP